jgi:hypothetical protein
MNECDDYSRLSDPAVIEERARIRELMEHQPEQEVDPELAERYRRITEEFDRRGAAAWSAAVKGSGQ